MFECSRGILGEGLGAVTLLKEVFNFGWAVRFQIPHQGHTALFSLSLFRSVSVSVSLFFLFLSLTLSFCLPVPLSLWDYLLCTVQKNHLSIKI